MSLDELFSKLKGGTGSGNFGHGGRPGKRGGSSSTSSHYFKTGADIGMLYHGGPSKISNIDPDKLQSRDTGYYGEGFYVTSSKDLAKAYGGKITQVNLKPNAKVLDIEGNLDPKTAPTDLVQKVQDSYMAQSYEIAKKNNRTDKVRENEKFIRDDIASSTISWKNAVKIYGERLNVDIIRYSPGETVIRNLDSIESLH